MIFFPDNIEVCFPGKTLAGQELGASISIALDEKLTAVMHDWAIPGGVS